ncbi:hypothetical protein ACWKWC_07440 [Geodermatophilus nigrescens]|uniref:hypothetical protein n=1 Tax=Geodermatophilus sp. FMUSA9-8 TaxID=3120155 RepID=UPI00300B196D
MAPVVIVTRADLEARRTALLEELGMTLPEFTTLAATKTLSGSEVEALEELEEIAFLLGE